MARVRMGAMAVAFGHPARPRPGVPGPRHDSRPEPDGARVRAPRRPRARRAQHPRPDRRPAAGRRLPDRDRRLGRRLDRADRASWPASTAARTRRARPIGQPAGFTIACALDPTADDARTEWDRLERKLDAGAHLVMTQPLYDIAQVEAMLAEARRRFGPSGFPVPLLLGVLPLVSSRHAEFLHNEVPGITIPDETRARMRAAGDRRTEVGIEMADALLAAVGDEVPGPTSCPASDATNRRRSWSAGSGPGTLPGGRRVLTRVPARRPNAPPWPALCQQAIGHARESPPTRVPCVAPRFQSAAGAHGCARRQGAARVPGRAPRVSWRRALPTVEPPRIRGRGRRRARRACRHHRRAGARGRAAVPGSDRRPGGLRHGRRLPPRDHRDGRGDRSTRSRRGPGPRSRSTPRSSRRAIDRSRPRPNARALMDQWGVGRKGFDDGLVILFDLDEQRCHGQVQLYAGPGLRGDVPLQQRAPGDLRGRHAAAPQASATSTARCWSAMHKVDENATPEHAAKLRRRRQLNAALGLVVAPTHRSGAGRLGALELAPLRPRPGLPRRSVDPACPAPPDGADALRPALVVRRKSSRRALTTAMLDLAARGLSSRSGRETGLLGSRHELRSASRSRTPDTDRRTASAQPARPPGRGARASAPRAAGHRCDEARRLIDPDDLLKLRQDVDGFDTQARGVRRPAAAGIARRRPRSTSRWGRRGVVALIGGVDRS